MARGAGCQFGSREGVAIGESSSLTAIREFCFREEKRAALCGLCFLL